jgi:hypothetical protein
MARLLILDDPSQTRGGLRPLGSVITVLADGADPGLMGGAQALVIDVPDLDVPSAKDMYLADGVPQAALDAALTERARYRADIEAALKDQAADLASGKVTQADVLATVTPFDETLKVNPSEHLWRSRWIDLEKLSGDAKELAERRAHLAETVAQSQKILVAQRGARADRVAEFKRHVQTALETAATVAGEDAATDPADASDVEDGEVAIRVAVLMEERKLRRLLRTRAVPPLTVTAAQLAAATVDRA